MLGPSLPVPFKIPFLPGLPYLYRSTSKLGHRLNGETPKWVPSSLDKAERDAWMKFQPIFASFVMLQESNELSCVSPFKGGRGKYIIHYHNNVNIFFFSSHSLYEKHSLQQANKTQSSDIKGATTGPCYAGFLFPVFAHNHPSRVCKLPKTCWSLFSRSQTTGRPPCYWPLSKHVQGPAKHCF